MTVSRLTQFSVLTKTPLAAPEFDRIPQEVITGIGEVSLLEMISRLRREVRNWYWVGPISWFVMRCPPRRFLSRTPLARLPISLRLRPNGTVACKINEFVAFIEIFVLRDYEIPGLNWRSITTIVDVGANVGIATIWFSRQAPASTILAIEPLPEAVSVLERNVADNGLQSRVRVRPIAIGGYSGVGHIGRSASSVGTRVTNHSLKNSAADEVEVASLARILAELNLERVDVLKLDCEGAEYDALAAADDETLGNVASIVGEYHIIGGHHPREIQERLGRAGFNVAILPHPRDPILGRFIARKRSAR